MNFGKGFQEGVVKGLPIGAYAHRQDMKHRQDAQKELEERQRKIAEKNKQTKGYAELTNLPYKTDPVTGEFQLEPPSDDWVFKKADPSLFGALFPEIGNEYQQAYTKLEQKNKPDYILSKRSYNPETGQGQVTALNRKTMQIEKIADDPTYVPKKTQSDIIDGEVDIDGEKFGKSGRRTRLMLFEDGTYKSIDLGRIRSGRNSETTTSELEFELDLADFTERVDNVRGRRNTYLKGNFADPEARDVYREGVNSDLDELALEFANLGSRTAQQEAIEIIKKSKSLIGGVGAIQMNRQQFYQMEKERLEEEWVAGEWGTGKDAYEDVTSLQKFLETKYGLYLGYEDAKKDSDVLEFDDILNNINLDK